MSIESAAEEAAKVSRYLAATPDEQTRLRALALLDFNNYLANTARIMGNSERFEVHRAAMCAVAATFPEAHQQWLERRAEDL